MTYVYNEITEAWDNHHVATVLERNVYNHRDFPIRWYLTSIESFDGKECIEIEYESVGRGHLRENPYFSSINVVRTGDLPDDDHMIIQAVLENKSFELIQSVMPSKVISKLIDGDFRELNFHSSSETRHDIGPLRRGRLDSLTLRDLRTGEILTRTFFDYDNVGFFPPASEASQHRYARSPGKGLLRLNGIRRRKGDGCGGTKQIYKFDYCGGSSSATEPDDHFGNLGGASVCEIATLDGETITYEYENGGFIRLTNGDYGSQYYNGYRVRKVTEDGGAGEAIVYNIDYADHEAEVNFNSFLREYQSDILYKMNYSRWKNGGYYLCMENYPVHYGEVTVSMAGSGKSVYNYYTAIDELKSGESTYSLKDDENEYHLLEPYRYRLEKVSYYNGSETDRLVKQVRYDYTVWPTGFEYYKPKTYAKQYFFADRIKSYERDENGQLVNIEMECCCLTGEEEFDNSFQNGLPAAVTARSLQLELYRIETEIDGVIETEIRYHNNDGLLEERIKLSDGKRLAEKYKYAYEVPEYGSVFGASGQNRLTTIALRQTTKDYPPIVMSAQLSTQAEFDGIYYDSKKYVWRTNRNANHIPSPAYDDNAGAIDEFDFANDVPKSPHTRWVLNSQINQRNSQGQITEQMLNAGTVPQATVYHADSRMPMAQVTNARPGECAIFTCDYDRNKSIGVSPYFDDLNSWQKPSGAALVDIGTSVGKFTSKAVSVTGVYGPKRNITIGENGIDEDKDYRFSAWVYPKNNEPIRLAVRLKDYLNLIEEASFDKEFTNLEQGKWQYIEHSVKSEDLKKYSHVTYRALEIWTGSNTGDPAPAEFYVTDIRFAPKDAYVTTNYYDKRNRLICTVDANDDAEYTEYDEWDRPVASRNNAKKLLRTTEYRLHGDLPCDSED